MSKSTNHNMNKDNSKTKCHLLDEFGDKSPIVKKRSKVHHGNLDLPSTSTLQNSANQDVSNKTSKKQKLPRKYFVGIVYWV